MTLSEVHHGNAYRSYRTGRAAPRSGRASAMGCGPAHALVRRPGVVVATLSNRRRDRGAFAACWAHALALFRRRSVRIHVVWGPVLRGDDGETLRADAERWVQAQLTELAAMDPFGG